MKEVEVKVNLEDVEETEKKLLSLGATFSGEVVQHDTYFRHPAKDFSVTDEALRIRTIVHNQGESYRITYKGPKLDDSTKTREEVETEIADPEKMRNILHHLGFQEVNVVSKRRRKYRLRDLTIDLDEVDGLGPFMEVEAMCGKGWEKTRDDILEFLRTLGFTKTERRSYLELLLEKT
ncbi:MAG: class IV adenylate cyclase [Candidatus Thermoplasmatota archaeon]|nr:class IV adenylate cyclase [Candidatus Thermoplasmatota archaeon]